MYRYMRRNEITDNMPDNEFNPIIDKRMQVVLWFAGLRGAMSFALVKNVPMYDSSTGHGTRFKAELKAMTSASILFTVFVLGGTTFYAMEHLGMSITKSDKSITDEDTKSLVKRTSTIKSQEMELIHRG